MDSLDLPKGEGAGRGKSTCIAAHASPEMFAKSGDYVGHSGIYRFPLVCLPDSQAMARARSLCSSNVADPCLFAAIPLPGWMPLRRMGTEVLPFSGEYSLGKT